MLSETLLTVGFTLETLFERLSLLFLSQAGWLLPAPLPFMHAHVDPQLSHSPDSHILHMKIIGSKLHFFALSHLGPTGSSMSLFPICRSMAVLHSLPLGTCLHIFPPSTMLQVLGSHLLLLGCHKFSIASQSLQLHGFLEDSPDHCMHEHTLVLSAAPAQHFLNIFLASQAGTEEKTNL